MKSGNNNGIKSLFGFNSIYLGTNYLWISFETLILPLEVENAVPFIYSGLYLGIVAFIGGLSAIAGNIASGVVGDHLHMQGAQRSIIVLFGSFMSITGILLSIPFYRIYAGIVISFALLQFFSNVAIGSTQPLLTETVESEKRGISSGINGLYTLIGSAAGFGITSFSLTNFPFSISVILIAIAMMATGSLSYLSVIRRKKIPVRIEEQEEKVQQIENNEKRLKILTAGSLFVFMGIMGLTYFEFYFFKVILNVSNPEILIGIAGILILALSSVSSIVVGRYSDRIGRMRILIISATVSAIPTFMIPYFRSYDLFLVLGGILGASYGSYYSVSMALAGDLANAKKAGTHLSIFNLSLSGASTISPLIYGFILYLFRNHQILSFHILFSTSSIFYLAGGLILYLLYRK